MPTERTIVQCDHCGARYSIESRRARVSAKCKHCNLTFVAIQKKYSNTRDLKDGQKGSAATGESTIIKIKLKEYELLRTEAMEHIRHFYQRTTHLNLLVTMITGAITYVGTESIAVRLNNWYYWYFAALIVASVANLLLADVACALYALMICGRRLGMIENSINEATGMRLLNWESIIVPHFYSSPTPAKWMINPNIFLSLWSAVLGLCAAVVFPMIVLFMIVNAGLGADSLSINIAVWFGVCIILISYVSLAYCFVRLVFGHSKLEEEMHKLLV